MLLRWSTERGAYLAVLADCGQLHQALTPLWLWPVQSKFSRATDITTSLWGAGPCKNELSCPSQGHVSLCFLLAFRAVILFQISALGAKEKQRTCSFFIHSTMLFICLRVAVFRFCCCCLFVSCPHLGTVNVSLLCSPGQPAVRLAVHTCQPAPGFSPDDLTPPTPAHTQEEGQVGRLHHTGINFQRVQLSPATLPAST